MRILISNDDGFLAPGIAALAGALAGYAEIAVVAPEGNRSGASSSLTLNRPISVSQGANGFFYITGTPSDCIHVGLTGILPWRPDLVVAGINHGENMGEDTIYSGTVAAAMEAFLFEVPAIAFSQVDKNWTDMEGSARIARDVIFRVYEKLPKPFLLNVNIPGLPYEEIRGILPTRLGRRNESAPVIRQKDPFGREMYWVGTSGAVKDGGEGTDFHAIENGYVSVTPLQLDWTNFHALHTLEQVLR